jgi:transposase
MAATVQQRCVRGEFVPREFDVFVGLDVDKKRIVGTFRDHSAAFKSLQFPYSAEQVLRYTEKEYPGQRIAFVYEAGPTGFGLYDGLTAGGHRCLVVAPSMVPQAPGQRVKTNRLDSRKLSENLRGGQLRSIHIPTGPYRQLRHLVQLRDSSVRQIKAAKCRIKALLLYEGIGFPDAEERWTRKVLKQLQELEANPAVTFKLASLRASLEFARLQAVATQREIRRYCRQEPELRESIQFLMTIPGIGWIVASHLVARLGDWRQLGNVRQIAAFLGLVASEYSTGDQVERGSITHLGDARLRCKLVQSSWVAIAKDSELRAFYRRIYSRHPRHLAARKAIVAVARKLTTRIHAVLTQRRPFEVRPERSSTPLTSEEIASPRGRLVGAQNHGR